MSKWTPIVGKGMSVQDFREYVEAMHLEAWKPTGIVLHNTAAPTLAQWHGSTPVPQRLKNLEGYYQGLGWHAGPHLFVADDFVWLFTPMTEPGVHSPSFNSTHLGVEMVGDYDVEAFDSGLGSKVRDNAVSVLATLCQKFSIDSHSILLHREDPKTTHACPGKHVVKPDVINRVHDEIVRRKNL